VGLGRALLWASVVLGLALTAHSEAGGHVPPVEAIALLGALLLAVAAGAVRRQIRWPGGLALAGLGQLAAHQAFAYLGGACPSPLPDGGAAHGHLTGPVPGVYGACAGAAEPAAIAPEMLAWHVLATVVAVGLLVGVERGLWLLASWLVRPLAVRPLRLPVAGRVLAPVLLGTPPAAVDVRVVRERGPPSSSALTLPPTPYRRTEHMTRFSLPARRALAAVPATAVLVLMPTVAYAHVTVNPDTTAAESYASLAFRVPTESDTASTEKVVVDLPTDTPFLSVTPRSLPGWDVEVEVEKLAEPFEVEGATVDEAPARVTWTAQKGNEVPPHEYQEFAVRVGALPAEGTDVVLPAHQTYTDGSVVDWDDLAGDDGKEPEAPAPAFTTTAAEGDGHGAPADAGTDAEAAASDGASAAGDQPVVDPVGRWLGAAGIVVGAVGIGAALVTRRRA
jgi:uncharacterized protein YcnI